MKGFRTCPIAITNAITNAMAIAIDCNKFEFIDSNRHCNRIRLNNPSFLVLCRFAALRRFVSIGPLHTQAMWEAIIREHLGSFSTELCHSMFGVEISVINHLYSLLPGHFLPVYLLWTLYFLKNYPVAEVAAAMWKISERTFRDWVWKIIFILDKKLSVIILNNRFHHPVFGPTFLAVDSKL